MSGPLPSGIKGGVRQSPPHDSAEKHVTGDAVYVDDMPAPPDLLHCAVVTSPHPHARIVGIDATPALALPGVVAALTAADIPGANAVGPIEHDEPALFASTADYIGAPVAVVAAETEAAALRAARAVAVTYAELPAVLTLDDAIAAESYLREPSVMAVGDADTAIDAAPHRLSGALRMGGQDHFYLEGQVALALPQEGRDLLVYSSTQHPTEVQEATARLLGLKMHDVTVRVRRLGGGFGGKESQATIIAALAALVADKTKRPAKLRLPRDADMIVTGKRHGFLVRYDAGFDGDGRLAGVRIDLYAHCGHNADLSPPVLTRALCHADNAYFLPHARLRGFLCRTNTVSNTAFRGFGGPQGMLAIETLLDDVARRLGKPPEAVRTVNLYAGTAQKTPYGQVVEDNLLDRIVPEVMRQADFDTRRAEIDAFNRASPVIKRGLAMMPIKFGISFNLPQMNQAGALVHVYSDGSVHLNHGGIEMGQGLFMKVAQVVAETFQIDADRIKLSETSTEKVPNTSPTAASTGSDLNGMAAHNAAAAIRGRMAATAAEYFGVAAEAIVFRENRVHAGNESLAFEELAEMCWRGRVSLSQAGFYKTPKIHWDMATNTGRPFFYFSYGAAVAEVAVDTLTGEARVLRADLLQDCGASLNPAVDLGQIEGGFVQGMGWLTCEELYWDADGRLRTHGPSTYKIPGSRDVPPDFRVHILDDAPNREDTIFKSKAIGEPPLMLAISVWLALRDAVAAAGVSGRPVPLDAPATPAAVLAAVEALQGGD